MRTHQKIGIGLAILSLATSAAAQKGAAALRKELKQRESAAAKDDADAIVESAKWASAKGVTKDAARLLKKALKIDPDHEGANTAMGLVKVGDEWVTREKAKDLEQKAHDADMKAKGFVQVDGVWVAKDKTDDAKRGVFWHDGQQVSRDDKRNFSMGRVRHPRTGVFIDADDLGKAESGMFPTDNGWVSEDEANKYHSDRNRPWVVRTEYATLLSTMPIAKLEEFKIAVDSAIDTVRAVFGGEHAPPTNRPTVWVAHDAEAYREYGNATGSGGESSYGVFLSPVSLDVPGLGQVRPAFCDNHKDWGPYYVKHAAALAYAAGYCAAHGVAAPEWFLRGVGALAERFQVPGQTAHFAKQHVAKGGVRTLKSWFSAFAINGEMEAKERDYNIFQAGLVLHYAMKGGDEKATAALQDLCKTIAERPKESAAKRAFEKFEHVIIDAQDGVRAHLQAISR
ncbi:MAG: hypothetical protein KDB80_10420 [Planctomycetes bacterium]|nr:hypothetical protein [Planctomycetota bacterium]